MISKLFCKLTHCIYFLFAFPTSFQLIKQVYRTLKCILSASSASEAAFLCSFPSAASTALLAGSFPLWAKLFPLILMEFHAIPWPSSAPPAPTAQLKLRSSSLKVELFDFDSDCCLCPASIPFPLPHSLTWWSPKRRRRSCQTGSSAGTRSVRHREWSHSWRTDCRRRLFDISPSAARSDQWAGHRGAMKSVGEWKVHRKKFGRNQKGIQVKISKKLD